MSHFKAFSTLHWKILILKSFSTWIGMNDNFPNAWKIMKFSEWNFWIFLISVGIEGWFNLIMNADRLKAGRSCLKLPIHPFIDRLTEQIRTQKNHRDPAGKKKYFFYHTKNRHIPNIDAISGVLITLRSRYEYTRTHFDEGARDGIDIW